MKRLRIKLNDITFFLILFLALLSGYLGQGNLAQFRSILNIVIAIIFSCVLGGYIHCGRIDKTLFFTIINGGILFVLFLSLSNILGTNKGFAWENIKLLLRILILIISLVLFINDKKADFFWKLRKCFWIFNIFGLLNMIVITIQFNIRGFFMPYQWLIMDSYYPDLCSGFFGYHGTHRLTFFMTFLFIYDLYMAKYVIKNNKKRIWLQVFNISLLFWNCILAIFNENKTLYLMTVVSLIIYIYLDNYWNGKTILSRITKWMKYLVAGLIFIVILFWIPATRDFLNAQVLSLFAELNDTNSITGVTRLRIILLAFEQGFGWKFGKGLGYYTINSSGTKSNIAFVGIQNFGEFDMPSLIYLMGIWFYIFYVAWISELYQHMIKGRDRSLFAAILLIMFFMSFYARNLTDTALAVYATLIFCVFCMMKESIKTVKGDAI